MVKQDWALVQVGSNFLATAQQVLHRSLLQQKVEVDLQPGWLTQQKAPRGRQWDKTKRVNKARPRSMRCEFGLAKMPLHATGGTEK